MYTAEEAEQISRLRHERWNLLAQFPFHHSSSPEYSQLNRRFASITMKLYKLTGNPIYNVEG